MSFFDSNLFGRRKTKRQKKRDVLADNRARGKAAEELAVISYSMRGYEVERTGKGSDLRVRRRNPFSGRVFESKLVEVKSGDAKLSKLQQKTKKKKRNYKVDRVNPPSYW